MKCQAQQIHKVVLYNYDKSNIRVGLDNQVPYSKPDLGGLHNHYDARFQQLSFQHGELDT